MSLKKMQREAISKRLAAILAATVVTTPMIARTVAITTGAMVAGSAILAAKPAQAALRYGFYDLGNGDSVAVFTANDARAYADRLTETTSFQNKFNNLAQILAKYTPWPLAVTVARILAYNGASWPLKLRIYWCASRSNTVYIYHKWYAPYYADPM